MNLIFMHNQRFFSYLSLFTFMMVILVTANNYLLMFVGWEGSQIICPKWLSQFDDSILKSMFIMYNCNQKRFFLNMPILKINISGGQGIHKSSYLFSLIPGTKRGFSTKKDLSDVKYTLKYKKEYVLSLEQKEALIGIILGDGFLDRAKSNHNTRLRIEQSYPEKEKYLRSLHELFEPMTTMPPTILTRKDKRMDSTTFSLYFRTLAMPCLNDYYDLFYKEKVKIIPSNLGQLLTARGLAYWIMDDGGKSVYNQTILHTRAFKLEEVEFIQSVLYENFYLRTRLEEKKKDQWIIYIPVIQKTKLRDIVGPYMHDSMLYKI